MEQVRECVAGAIDTCSALQGKAAMQWHDWLSWTDSETARKVAGEACSSPHGRAQLVDLKVQGKETRL